jgi:hypothetical protein
MKDKEYMPKWYQKIDWDDTMLLIAKGFGNLILLGAAVLTWMLVLDTWRRYF